MSRIWSLLPTLAVAEGSPAAAAASAAAPSQTPPPSPTATIPPTWAAWTARKCAEAVTYEVHRRRGALPPSAASLPSVADALAAALDSERRRSPAAAVAATLRPAARPA